jgi:hypothetical protein
MRYLQTSVHNDITCSRNFLAFFSAHRLLRRQRGVLAVAAQSLILALNETRKTLLASRLMIADHSRRRDTTVVDTILPGDGVWIEPCKRVDTSGMRASLDLLFLDSDRRVVAAVADVPPGSACAEVEKATGVLELAAGTIRLTQTETGDHVVLEPIVAPPAEGPFATRGSRSRADS